ncbi:unnamed protein product [Brugia timori]|uniref:Uncharacterized protein n=1 Tax=Brugia timori TaxID=42155 RepID=A0A0R3QG47_9BILA|nr:unnamed protein product [Brugia timori]
MASARPPWALRSATTIAAARPNLGNDLAKDEVRVTTQIVDYRHANEGVSIELDREPVVACLREDGGAVVTYTRGLLGRQRAAGQWRGRCSSVWRSPNDGVAVGGAAGSCNSGQHLAGHGRSTVDLCDHTPACQLGGRLDAGFLRNLIGGCGGTQAVANDSNLAAILVVELVAGDRDASRDGIHLDQCRHQAGARRAVTATATHALGVGQQLCSRLEVCAAVAFPEQLHAASNSQRADGQDHDDCDEELDEGEAPAMLPLQE